MTEGKWTKGPWAECKEGGCSCGYIFGDDGKVYVAKAITLDNDSVDPAPTDDTAIANAHLIAAAPSLFEALKAIVDCYGVGSTPEKFVAHVHDLIMDARPVLARALGTPNP